MVAEIFTLPKSCVSRTLGGPLPGHVGRDRRAWATADLNTIIHKEHMLNELRASTKDKFALQDKSIVFHEKGH